MWVTEDERQKRRSLRSGKVIGMVSVLVALALTAGGGAKELMYTVRHVKSVKAGYWEATATYPSFQSTFPVAKLANRVLAREARESIARFNSEALQLLRGDHMKKPEASYGHDWTPIVSLSEPNLISVYCEVYDMMGGAHPNHGYAFYTFGLVNGKARQLKLKDLFLPGTDPRKTVSDLIMPELKSKQAGWVENGELKQIDAKQAECFVMTQGGLTFLFEPYSVGSYAEGSYEVKLTYCQIGMLNPKGPLSSVR